MTSPQRADTVDGQSGFTLLELMVVLGILALTLAIAAPSLSRAREPLLLRSAAYELAGHLRSARAAARTGNIEHALTIDPAQRAYWAQGVVAQRPLPAGVRVLVPDSERLGTAAGRVRFFPDGSSSGARIVLDDGRRTAAVSVDWLNGDVRVQWRP
jgi:general secretion pathway protein H